jgi:hypothetical protein
VVQVAAVEILLFLDGIKAAENRRFQMMQSAVSSGWVNPAEAWPDYFSRGDDGDDPEFPSTSDMEAFELEEATPESFANDIERLIAAQSQVTVREEPPAPSPPELPYGLPDPEWT